MAWTRTATDAGAELIAAAFGRKLELTSVKCGSILQDHAALAAQTDIEGYFLDGSLTEQYNIGNHVHFRAQINNLHVTEVTPLAQIGIFGAAYDDTAPNGNGTEALLLIFQNDTPSTLPPITENYPPVAIDFLIDLAISSMQEITINYDYGAFVTVGMLDNTINNSLFPLDLGNWDEEQTAADIFAELLTAHASDPAAHPNLAPDGGGTAALEQMLDEHNNDASAHQNLKIDGNG
jgi:hypothetical protein